MGNNFVFLMLKCIKTDNNSELEAQSKVFLIYNPKTIICEAQAIKAGTCLKENEARRLFKRKRA